MVCVNGHLTSHGHEWYWARSLLYESWTFLLFIFAYSCWDRFQISNSNLSQSHKKIKTLVLYLKNKTSNTLYLFPMLSQCFWCCKHHYSYQFFIVHIINGTKWTLDTNDEGNWKWELNLFKKKDNLWMEILWQATSTLFGGAAITFAATISNRSCWTMISSLVHLFLCSCYNFLAFLECHW